MSQAEFNREVLRLFRNAVDETFYSSSGFEISTRNADTRSDQAFGEICLLTISSLDFRILTLIWLNDDASSHNFVAQKLGTNADQVGSDRFYDFIGELGNTLCGSIKRSLNSSVPSLGMSTPNHLGSDCTKYLTTQHPNFENHSRIKVDGVDLFECSVYVCSTDELNYNIQAASSFSDEADDVESGELELF